ncbi:uncharacterized protein V6R79_003157 [Siganus canaliculatus]
MRRLYSSLNGNTQKAESPPGGGTVVPQCRCGSSRFLSVAVVPQGSSVSLWFFMVPQCRCGSSGFLSVAVVPHVSSGGAFFEKQIPHPGASTHMQMWAARVFSITCSDLHSGFVWVHVSAT